MAQATRKALGRGLSSLLDDIDEELSPSSSAAAAQTPPAPRAPNAGAPADAQRIAIDLIHPNADQPRKYFDESDLSDLTASIKEKGVIQPILVRPSPKDPGHFELIAGERRWRAAQRASLHEIPAVIREMDDAGALEVGIIENVQRSDLNAMEEAYGYRALMDRFGYTQEILARNIGKSRSHIANIMRLVTLPKRVQDMVRTGELSAGHARTVIGAADPVALAEQISKKGLSVRQAERLAKGEGGGGSFDGPGQKDRETRELEGVLSVALRMPVTIKHRGKEGGEVRIAYRTLDDLEELTRILQGEAGTILAGDV